MFCWQNGRAGNEAVWLRNISLTADCRPKTLLENNTGPSSLIVSHCLGKLKMSTNQPASAYWQGSPPDQTRATTVPFGKWVGRKVAVRWRWIIKSSSNLQDTAQTGQMTVPDDSQRIEDHHYILCLLQPPSWTWLASYLSKLGVIKPILPQPDLWCSPLSCQIFIERKTTVKIGFSPAKTSEIKKCKWNT